MERVMKRILSLAILVGFLLFIPKAALHAEVTGPPDITTRVSLPNSIDFAEIGERNGVSFLSGIKPFFNPTIVGEVGFEGSSQNKPQGDVPVVFSWLGPQLKLTYPFLTPEAIATRIQPINTDYTYTTTSTLCLASDNDNKQAFPLKERIVMPAEGLSQTMEAGVMLSGLLAPQVTVTKDTYEHLNELFPNVLGSILKNPACDQPPPTRAVAKERVGASSPEEYTVPPDKLPVYLFNKWISSLPKIGALCSETNCNLTANPMFDLLLKTKIPYIGEISKNLMNDPLDPNSKQVGALATFVSDRFSIQNRHGAVTNQIIEQTIKSSSEPLKTPINYALAKTAQDYYQFTNCSVYPDSLQSTKLDYSCNFSENDATSDRSLAGWYTDSKPLDSNFSSNVFQQSTQDEIRLATDRKIPACVLEAVKYIETGTQTDFSGACPVNECSAAGPYQVTTGAAPASGGGWDTKCTQCPGPDWSKGIKDCPDGWPGDWPKNQSNPSPCSDTKAAARRAVEMLQEKAVIRCEVLNEQPTREAIITAAGSYYGSNERVARLGGCSYGEFVYKHCDGSYVCGTKNVDLGVKYEQCQAKKKL
ncbi:MAG: hypothetical protein Q8L37_04945 [Candidatus Gottesmanbacteria bacterium]|nr:hypothetical protein [Candidatus Gottesmanbacteria bacterium]